jgi:hypothetical protein
MRRFIDLYILCEKLLDPISANSVIDKLVSFTSKQNWRLNSDLVIHIYASTADGNLLRWLACDWYMYDGTHMWPLTLPVKQWAGLPATSCATCSWGMRIFSRLILKGRLGMSSLIIPTCARRATTTRRWLKGNRRVLE